MMAVNSDTASDAGSVTASVASSAVVTARMVPAPGSTTGSASDDPLLAEVHLDGLVNLRICVPELQVNFKPSQ